MASWMKAERGRWTNRVEFIMAAIGSAVGLGNVWRFPYMVYENGGAAFFIPYIIALFTTGIPLMILECAIGKRFQKGGPDGLGSLNPHFRMVGWFAVLVSAVISIYYAVVMAWCMSYLWHSLSLAWGSDAQLFFFEKVLNISAGPFQIQNLSLQVLIGLLITWIVIYFCISKGVPRLGKVALLTVPIPLVLLSILVVRGVTLPGAMEGLSYYLTPDFQKLLNPKVWLAAYGQIFFSLSLGFAILIAYASYLPKRTEISNSAFITSFADSGFSYFAGFAVFSTLGFLAQSQNIPVSEVIKSGPILAFVTYPTAISQMGGFAALFGVAFFIMLLILGIDSAFSIVESVVTAMHDRLTLPRVFICKIVCIVGFLGGVFFATGAGLYWLDIVDHWFTHYGLTVVGVLESVLVGWLVSTNDLVSYINETAEIRVGRLWKFSIRYVTPLVLGGMLLLTLWQELRAPYGGYPWRATLIGGWGLIAVVVIGAFILSRKKSKKALV